MSFLRNVPKNQLKRSALCVCFCRCVWQNLNHMVNGIEYPSPYRRLHHSSYLLAKKASDHYKALGVSRRATAQDIKDAYYELSKRYHPDKNKGSDLASERFREIKEAYEVLGNHGKKRRYDRVSPSSGAFTQQARTGNEIVAQDTDAYSRHMTRYTKPMGDRPTAQAIDKSLSDQNSEIFRKRQKWLAQKVEFEDDTADREKSFNNVAIVCGIVLVVAAIGKFIKHSNEKRYEQMIRENKEKKSK